MVYEGYPLKIPYYCTARAKYNTKPEWKGLAKGKKPHIEVVRKLI